MAFGGRLKNHQARANNQFPESLQPPLVVSQNRTALLNVVYLVLQLYTCSTNVLKSIQKEPCPKLIILH